MKRINRLLIDSSSVLMACLFAAKDGENCILTTFNEKEEVVPAAGDGYEIFLSALLTTMKDLNFTPNQVILVKDGKGSRKLRQEVYPPYKKRPEKNPVFLEQFNLMQDMVEETLWSYGALSVVKDGYEADDILAAAWAKGDWIWSKDGDLMAAGDWYYNGVRNPSDKFLGIAKEHIVVYKSLVGDSSDKIPGCKGFGPAKFQDMLIKYGDEGCDEILDMLENDTLNELKDAADEFKPFQMILDDVDRVRQSYYCAKFHHPGWDLDWQCRFPETNGDLGKWERTETLMTASNLDLDEVRSRLSKSRGYIGLDIETYEDEESLEWGLANANDKGPKLDVYGSHMTGLSLTCGENNEHVYYFPVEHLDTANLNLDQLTEILNLIPDGIDVIVHNNAFELPIVRQHCELRFDRGWLPNVLDTAIEKSYVDENTPAGLKYCSKVYMKYRQVSYDEVVSQEVIDEETGEVTVIKRRMNEIPATEVVSYGADDSVVTAQLHSQFRAIMDYEGTSDAFDQCEQWSAYMFAEAFLNGINLNLDRLEELRQINEAEAVEVKAEVDSYLMKIEGWPGTTLDPVTELTPAEVKRSYLIYTGEPLTTRVRNLDKMGKVIEGLGKRRFGVAVAEGDIDTINELMTSVWKPAPELNMGSPKQKCALLYDYLKYPVRLYGKVSDKMRAEGRKKGNPQANEAAFKFALINDAKSEDEKALLKAIIKGVALQTEQSLYFNPYPKMPNPKDGMVHPSTGQSKTTSRRMAPNAPNYAQVSKKSPIREVYDTFSESSLWVSLDWSGQELRGTAWQSQCSEMLKCYPKNGIAKDLHSMTAVKIDNMKGGDLNYEEVLSILADDSHEDYSRVVKLRKDAKAPAFGNIYGQTPIGLAMNQLIPEEEAELMFEALFAAFPGVGKWKEKREAFFKKNGYAVTLLGARKHLLLDGSWKDGHSLRSAGNFEIQSSAAEQMKLAISKFWVRKVFERHVGANFLMVVHDEANFCVEKGPGLLPFVKEVHEIMCEQYASQDIPVESSIEVGDSFGALRDIGTTFDEDKLLSVINSL
jgi:DNA polymerase I-like protein with 3'-5' exonuclease and polymerase domains/5'-3' exonuclease